MSADLNNAAFIEVSAEVRYWEDAELDGVEDGDGLIPLRKGSNWEPVINLKTGAVKDWPTGLTADIHYKVCDAGLYWLQDEVGQRIAQWNGYCVPNDILCVANDGYGDYIIFKIGSDGKIIGWHAPRIDPKQWAIIARITGEGES